RPGIGRRDPEPLGRMRADGAGRFWIGVPLPARGNAGAPLVPMVAVRSDTLVARSSAARLLGDGPGAARYWFARHAAIGRDRRGSVRAAGTRRPDRAGSAPGRPGLAHGYGAARRDRRRIAANHRRRND